MTAEAVSLEEVRVRIGKTDSDLDLIYVIGIAQGFTSAGATIEDEREDEEAPAPGRASIFAHRLAAEGAIAQAARVRLEEAGFDPRHFTLREYDALKYELVYTPIPEGLQRRDDDE